MPSHAKNQTHMASHKMGASGTSTILLVGGGLLLVYLFMRKPTTAPPTLPAPAPPQPQGASTTNTAISAGASIANNLINQIFG